MGRVSNAVQGVGLPGPTPWLVALAVCLAPSPDVFEPAHGGRSRQPVGEKGNESDRDDERRREW